MLGFDQVEFVVSGVKFSFYVNNNYCPVSKPVPYLRDIRLADVDSIMKMKMGDYYNIYAMLKEGYDISKGIEATLKYSEHKLSSKNIVVMLLSNRFTADENFEQLEPKYDLTKE